MRSFCILLFSAFCSLALIRCSLEQPPEGDAAEAASAPNIILIFADDLGYGDLACYGHPTIETPNLDRLAREGRRYTQFYVGAEICTPSRTALLTGRYPVRSGMTSNQRSVLFPDSGGGLPASEYTLAEALQEAGYRTGCVGKWHLGHLPQHLPNQHGFDYYFGIPYSNDMSPEQSDWEGAKKFPPTPLIEQDSIIESEPDQRQITRRYTAQAIRFIDNELAQGTAEQPFFLYFPHTFPHVPLYASEQFEGSSKRGLYGDVVSELDWSVGQLYQKIQDAGLAENTIIVFTSDNGPWLVMREEGGSAGLLREGKGSAWEGGVRVPAIAWWPGQITPAVPHQTPWTSMDLYAGLVSIGGGQLPSDRTLDGNPEIGRAQLIGTDSTASREIFYYLNERLAAVRFGDYKAHFITYTPYRGQSHVLQDPPLLYNLSVDPSEQYDIAADHPEIVADLQARARAHSASIEPVINQLTIPLE
ncbi:MAG: sulfatase [Bacteroidota bacterium]